MKSVRSELKGLVEKFKELRSEHRTEVRRVERSEGVKNQDENS